MVPGRALPLGAPIARADLLEPWSAEGHDSTLGGNPVACAAGLATLQLIGMRGLLRNAEERGATLRQGMTDIAYQWPEIVTDVRGVGLMLGMEFASLEVARTVVHAAFRRGLLTLMADNPRSSGAVGSASSEARRRCNFATAAWLTTSDGHIKGEAVLALYEQYRGLRRRPSLIPLLAERAGARAA
jgi:Aminotransferase class-III